MDYKLGYKKEGNTELSLYYEPVENCCAATLINDVSSSYCYGYTDYIVDSEEELVTEIKNRCQSIGTLYAVTHIRGKKVKPNLDGDPEEVMLWLVDLLAEYYETQWTAPVVNRNSGNSISVITVDFTKRVK